MNGTGGESAMTVMGTLSSFREPGEMSPHKRASLQWLFSWRDAVGSWFGQFEIHCIHHPLLFIYMLADVNPWPDIEPE
jgi:hypothetical protein